MRQIYEPAPDPSHLTHARRLLFFVVFQQIEHDNSDTMEHGPDDEGAGDDGVVDDEDGNDDMSDKGLSGTVSPRVGS